MSEIQPLVDAVRAGLAALADPVKAPQMRRYMRSEMPYRGVPAPQRRALLKRAFAEHPLPDHQKWVTAIGTLWRTAEFREERYAAIDLADDRRYVDWRTTGLLPLYEEMIVSGGWWDYVDELAIRHVGPLLLTDHDTLAPVMRSWSTDTDRWKRRTSIICQIKAGDRTDLTLLAACIEANVAEPDFFVRKGIGWALRQYARTDPRWVHNFVTGHPALSALSVREALKHIR